MNQTLKKLLVIICWLCLLQFNAEAQDLHFSQFTTTPTYINPAFTGKFNGEGRFILNQRTQWRSVTVPYVTYAASADFNQIKAAPNVGLGLSLYRDQAGDSRLSTTKADLAFSYSIPLSYNRKHSLVFGLQGGLKNLSIDYSALRFDNQYNGTAYDAARATGENFSYQNLLTASASSGLSYFYSSKDLVMIGGFAVYNLLNTNTSFFEGGSSPLDQRYTMQVSAEWAPADAWVIQPAMFWGQQGTLQEWLVGAKGKFVSLDDKRYYRSFSAGAFYRNRDALVLTLNTEWNDYNIGLSYDFNTSGLRKASNYRGGLELSLVYIYSSKRAGSRKFSSCPIFI